ncbi:cation:proton antiporter [Streptomyces sp. LX-29]|uniref:cation:proton antiporter domain-containing protein n=1 Tax=Streptomyces sp. LX-29 TaxID=2900152 RepID=UPI00240D5D2B|nr:cation:proton antiporter [Streptomyces sp. LX-29]WFB10895.1 cation:proton antiporter [Streptomyces sp. LX-29]
MAGPHALPLDAIVMADIAIVLLAGAGVLALARRLRQPPVIGEIAVGIALGPSVLGLLPGDLPQRIFPDEARPLLSAVAQLGLLLFMFLAGWELDGAMLRGRQRAVISMAASAMAVPFALGAGLAVLLAAEYGGDTGTSAFVLYLGTAMSITAFPVLARILSDSGMIRTPVGVLAMACAAIGDVMAWCLLVVVVAVAEADGGGRVVEVIVLTVLYALVMALVVRPFLRWALHRAGERAAAGRLFTVVGAGALLSSYVTSWIGTHAIFGAFAFGLAMPRQLRQGLRESIEEPLSKVGTLLLPVFFIITGLSVDFGSLGWSDVVVLAAILAVAVAGKLAGAMVPARLAGLRWREATAFGVLMNTRGLTELVILDVGRRLGVIDARLFAIMVVMALVTTAMAGPLLHLLGVTDPPADTARLPAQGGGDDRADEELTAAGTRGDAAK